MLHKPTGSIPGSFGLDGHTKSGSPDTCSASPGSAPRPIASACDPWPRRKASSPRRSGPSRCWHRARPAHRALTWTLVSMRHRLIGRSDHPLRAGGFNISEEWKSSRQAWPWHVIQLGVYILLVEERYRRRPPNGYVVCSDGKRHRIENYDRLRTKVIALAGQPRAARRANGSPIPINPER